MERQKEQVGVCGSDSDVVKFRDLLRCSYLHFCEFLTSWNKYHQPLSPGKVSRGIGALLTSSYQDFTWFTIFLPNAQHQSIEMVRILTWTIQLYSNHERRPFVKCLYNEMGFNRGYHWMVSR